MLPRIRILVLAFALASLGAGTSRALPSLFGGCRDNDFGAPPARFMVVNAATGNGTTVGAGVGASYSGFTGLEYDPPTAKFYAILQTTAGVHVLATIDEVTGLATTIGALGTSGLPFDLAFGPGGTLYTNLAGGANTLHTINKTTGALSPPIGSLGRSVAGLTFDNLGTLYGVDLDNSALLTIDPATAAVLTSTPAIGPITLTRGLCFAEGKLWGADGGSNSFLLTIDRATALVTVIGPTNQPHTQALAVKTDRPVGTKPSTWGRIKALFRP